MDNEGKRNMVLYIWFIFRNNEYIYHVISYRKIHKLIWTLMSLNFEMFFIWFSWIFCLDLASFRDLFLIMCQPYMMNFIMFLLLMHTFYDFLFDVLFHCMFQSRLLGNIIDKSIMIINIIKIWKSVVNTKIQKRHTILTI